jgi:hypothetical protein
MQHRINCTHYIDIIELRSMTMVCERENINLQGQLNELKN